MCLLLKYNPISNETVSQFVISRLERREIQKWLELLVIPGFPFDVAPFGPSSTLRSVRPELTAEGGVVSMSNHGSCDAIHQSSGMTGFVYYDTVATWHLSFFLDTQENRPMRLP
jgi:hypothetical protein